MISSLTSIIIEPAAMNTCIYDPFCSTLKQGCAAGIKLSLSDDRQCLKVVEVSEEHNHEISKVCL